MDNKRAYRRSSHFNGKVCISKDSEDWLPADVADVSSGGLKLYTSAEYAEGDVLWFDMVLEGFFSEINVLTKGEVCRRAPYMGQYQYGIAFRELNPEKAVQIDENIRNDRPVFGQSYEVD